MDGDGDTHLINLKHQRVSMEYDQCDRISNLPDSLLFDILSFLKMEDVIKTSLLSRKWRYFWTTVPCLNFKASWEMIERAKYEAFVDRALFAYEASKIKKFRLSYFYRVDSNAFQVDSWIRFAIRHHVEDFELDFIRGSHLVPEDGWDHNTYKLHSSCFNCMSLTSLKLRFCNLNLPASMFLNSLKFLSLEVMELSYDTIKKLTSSCPVLEELFLKECNWRNDLIICIPELPLKSLKIEECSTYSSYRNTMFEIYAPNLVSLEFLGYMQRSKYRFKGPSSLLKMIFDVDGDYLEYGENDGHPLRQFLDDLKHVKDLKVGAWSVQAMSISELKKSPALSLGANSLELVTALSEWELPGLAYILRSCPFLKTLIITVETSQLMMFTREFQNKYECDVRIHWEPQELALSSSLHHIETIKLLCFSEELMDGEAKTTDELINAHMSQIKLVRFFLQNCKLLQKMILTRHMDSRLAGKPLKLPLKFSQQLLEFPRASTEAELIFL